MAKAKNGHTNVSIIGTIKLGVMDGSVRRLFSFALSNSRLVISNKLLNQSFDPRGFQSVALSKNG
jgi:hypothetical protein